jgi:protoheme IX farnesyltransferase
VLRDAQDEGGVSLSQDKPARAAFKFSILYLFLLFAACAVDRLI